MIETFKVSLCLENSVFEVTCMSQNTPVGIVVMSLQPLLAQDLVILLRTTLFGEYRRLPYLVMYG